MKQYPAQIESSLKELSHPEQVAGASRFFKTGPGEYGEGDVFWGIKVPDQRGVVRRFKNLVSLEDVTILLASEVHEVRLTGVLLLVEIFKAAKTPGEKEKVIRLYEGNFSRINNWDLVDSSAPYLTGPWYFDKPREALFRWASSSHLWTQRIAIMTTFFFIRQGDFSTTLTLADQLLGHPHDLMHKAVGWMLREVGNRNLDAEQAYLTSPLPGGKEPRYKIMPRTMLRYAIEKFPKPLYQAYLKGMVENLGHL